MNVIKDDLSPSSSASPFAEVLEQFQQAIADSDATYTAALHSAFCAALNPPDRTRIQQIISVASRGKSRLLPCLTYIARAFPASPGAPDTLKICLDALAGQPGVDLREWVLKLANDGQPEWLAAYLHRILRDVPPDERLGLLIRQLGLLPDGVVTRIPLDSLISGCLEATPSSDIDTWLDPLLRKIPLRELRQEQLQEEIASVYAKHLPLCELKPSQMHRLNYLLRFAAQPMTRARLLLRADLCGIVQHGPRTGESDIVVKRLEHFPGVLEELPHDEVVAALDYVLQRIVLSLDPAEHWLLARALCLPGRPEPFLSCYLNHLQKWTARVSNTSKVSLWGNLFGVFWPRGEDRFVWLMTPLLNQALVRMGPGLRKEVARYVQQHCGEILPTQFGMAPRFSSSQELR